MLFNNVKIRRDTIIREIVANSKLLIKNAILGVLFLVLQIPMYSPENLAQEKNAWTATPVQLCVHHASHAGLFAAAGEYWQLYYACRYYALLPKIKW